MGLISDPRLDIAPRRRYNPRVERFFAARSLPGAILDRLLHHPTTVNIKGDSYHLKDKRRAGLLRPATTPESAE